MFNNMKVLKNYQFMKSSIRLARAAKASFNRSLARLSRTILDQNAINLYVSLCPFSKRVVGLIKLLNTIPSKNFRNRSTFLN